MSRLIELKATLAQRGIVYPDDFWYQNAAKNACSNLCVASFPHGWRWLDNPDELSVEELADRIAARHYQKLSEKALNKRHADQGIALGFSSYHKYAECYRYTTANDGGYVQCGHGWTEEGIRRWLWRFLGQDIVDLKRYAGNRVPSSHAGYERDQWGNVWSK